jgi:hypothetical protein
LGYFKILAEIINTVKYPDELELLVNEQTELQDGIYSVSEVGS